MDILFVHMIPETVFICSHTIVARRRLPGNCFMQPVVNTTVKTAAVPNAAVAVPVGTTPVIAAMITTVIVPVLTAAVIASWHDRRRRHARTGGPGAALSRSTHGRVHSTAFFTGLVAASGPTRAFSA